MKRKSLNLILFTAAYFGAMFACLTPMALCVAGDVAKHNALQAAERCEGTDQAISDTLKAYGFEPADIFEFNPTEGECIKAAYIQYKAGKF